MLWKDLLRGEFFSREEFPWMVYVKTGRDTYMSITGSTEHNVGMEEWSQDGGVDRVQLVERQGRFVLDEMDKYYATN